MRSLLPTGLLCMLLLAACSSSEPVQPEVTVYHRCGELNFDELTGHYGRLEGGSNVNGRFRVLFQQEGEAVTARYVAGNADRWLLSGQRTGAETMTFDEIGSGASGGTRRMKASITSDCRLQLDSVWVQGGSETAIPSPDGLNLFVPWPQLERFDFEPCTELLQLRGAAKTRGASKPWTRPEAPIPVSEDTLPMGVYGPASELEAGCSASMDLWLDGEAVGLELPVPPARSGSLHWYHAYETQYVGTHHVALHRKATCGETTRLLGVACTEIEVK